MREQKMAQIQLHVPTDIPENPPLPLAKRPKSLEGIRLGILDNGKEFSAEVLEAISQVMKRDYGVAEISPWRKGFPSKAAPFIAEMAETCDAVVNGVGHCGSSSPWSARDGVALENAGVPSVTLISTAFCPLGHVVAQGLSFPALPIVVLPHPLGDHDPDKVAKKGHDAVTEIVRLLTTPSEAVFAEYIDKKYPLPPFAEHKF
jgi:hypothetical protein